MVVKVSNRIQGWQGKLLSYGGKAVMIKAVLHSLPLYLLSAVSPPKTILNQVEKIIARFYWGSDDGSKKYHWKSWKDLCFWIQKFA